MRIIHRTSVFLPQSCALAICDEEPRFRLCLPSNSLKDEADLRNNVLNFGFLLTEREMTPRQRALTDLCRFDGSTHNGGLGMGFEVFEEDGRIGHYDTTRLAEFFQLLRDIEAHDHLRIIQTCLAPEGRDQTQLNHSYYALHPDLVTLAARYIARVPNEWIVIQD